MPAILSHKDIAPVELRRPAKVERGPRVARRLLVIAEALDGLNSEAAARVAGMDRQTLCDWAI